MNSWYGAIFTMNAAVLASVAVMMVFMSFAPSVCVPDGVNHMVTTFALSTPYLTFVALCFCRCYPDETYPRASLVALSTQQATLNAHTTQSWRACSFG